MARISKPKPVRAAKAQARKAHKVKAAVHAARKPTGKRKLAHRPSAPRQVASLAPPKGYPDGRLMMTRLGPPAEEPQFALVRTTTCTTGVPGGRLMPFLVGTPIPTGPQVTGDEIIFLPPVPEPLPPVGGGGVDIFPPPVPPEPPGPPGAIPEPSTWAMLIVGFGVVGATLRRRRAITA